MAIKYTKWPEYTYFWLENIPSGNPGPETAVVDS
jgi:hypothetical protein